MKERTLDLSWMRLAVAGLLVCLALLLAVVIFMPAQAQSGCVEWDDHGNCVAWEQTVLDTNQPVAASSTATPAPTPEK